MKPYYIFRLFAAGALIASAAWANLITNGSFETAGAGVILPTGNGAALTNGSTAISGWTVLASAGAQYNVAWLPTGNGYGVTPENGSYFLDLTGYNDVDPFSGVQQTVNLASGNYALSFYVGVDNSNGLYAGPASVYVSAGNQSNVVFTNSSTGTGNVWDLETLNFTVATSGDTTITFKGDATESRSGEQYIGLDNVDLESTAAPEPAMALPLLFTLAGLVMWARRRVQA